MNVQDLQVPCLMDLPPVIYISKERNYSPMLNAHDLLKSKVKIKETPKKEKALSNKDKFSKVNYDRMQMHRDQGYSVDRTAELNNCSRNTVLRNTTAPDKSSIASIWEVYRMIKSGELEEKDIMHKGEIAGRFIPSEDFKDDK